MRFEQVILDLDQGKLDLLNEPSKEDMERVLKSLIKRKFVKENKDENGDQTWIRCFPKRKSWLSKLFS